jgi:hypothetical protein
MEPESSLKKYGEGVVMADAPSLKVFWDRDGEPWLCDSKVDPRKDLEAQGCWRCRDLAFTASD